MVKLLRTDTTLDLSQKARVVRKQESGRPRIYGIGARTDHEGRSWVYLALRISFSQVNRSTIDSTLRTSTIRSCKKVDIIAADTTRAIPVEQRPTKR